MPRTAIDARIAAALQIVVAAICGVVGVMSLRREFDFDGRDLTGAGHLAAAAFLVAAVVLGVLAGLNLLARVVVDGDGVTVSSVGRSQRMPWTEIESIDFGSTPATAGTTVVLRTVDGALIGTGVLRLRRRGNVFAFAKAVDEAGRDSLVGERLRRYLDSNGLYA